MLIESAHDAKARIQMLTESVWIFSTLRVMQETGALLALVNPTSLANLETVTKLPIPVLEHSIQLLCETGFLIVKDSLVQLAPGMQILLENSFEKFSAPLQVTSGLTNAFLQSAQQRTLKMGWHHRDESLLQAQGVHSEFIVSHCIPQDSQLLHQLKQHENLFLDVGAGVGKISLALCHSFPKIKVVALEPAEMPFSLAEKNIQQSIYQDRIELRKEYLEKIADKNVFDIAWFPQVFFTDDIVDSGLKKIYAAIKPGATLLTHVVCSESRNQSTLIRELIHSLCGSFRTAHTIHQLLIENGFESIQFFEELGGHCMIKATKPAVNNLT